MIPEGLHVSESGIRGIAGVALTPELALACARRFAHGRRRVLVARDTRRSGPSLASAAISGLLAGGAAAADAGVLSTPTAQVAVASGGFDGGIVVTASHNPPQWNALKLLDSRGRFLARRDVRALVRAAVSDESSAVRHGFSRSIERGGDWVAGHLDLVLALVDTEALRRRALHVVLDTSNGAGQEIGERLLDACGCRFEVLHDDADPVYHLGQPRRHFRRLRDRVRAASADIGIGWDPDGDRLTIVDELGVLHREDYGLALAVESCLERRAGPVVVNDSTSSAVAEVAARFGVECLSAAVGEHNVVELMDASGAVVGGEGNGGVIVPEVHYGRDAQVGTAVLLDLLARRRARMSELLAPFAGWRCLNTTIPASDASYRRLARGLGRMLPPSACGSGLKFGTPSGWVTLRRSNTEPVLRVIAESRRSRPPSRHSRASPGNRHGDEHERLST